MQAGFSLSSFFPALFSLFNILTIDPLLFVTCNWKATELQPNPPSTSAQQDVVKCINLLFPIFFPHKFPVQTTRKTCTWRKEKQGKNVRSLSVWNILFRFLLATGIWGFVRPFYYHAIFWGIFVCVFASHHHPPRIRLLFQCTFLSVHPCGEKSVWGAIKLYCVVHPPPPMCAIVLMWNWWALKCVHPCTQKCIRFAS